MAGQTSTEATLGIPREIEQRSRVPEISPGVHVTRRDADPFTPVPADRRAVWHFAAYSSAISTSLICYASRLDSLPRDLSGGFAIATLVAFIVAGWFVAMLTTTLGEASSIYVRTSVRVFIAAILTGGIGGYFEAHDGMGIANNLNAWSGMAVGFALALVFVGIARSVTRNNS